jgi:hypothetical protein
MGCSTSKASSSALVRMLEYEQMAATEEHGLKLAPAWLDTGEWRDGLISTRSMFNLFHAGYCSAYIQNPTYLLVRAACSSTLCSQVLDFRSLEEWLEERVVTSLHHDRLQYLEKCTAPSSSSSSPSSSCRPVAVQYHRAVRP